MTESEADSKVFADSKLFEDVIRPLLQQGLSVRFQARGASMSPAIRDQEVVQVTPVMVTELRKDDIVLAKSHCGFRLHRIVLADPAKDVFVTRGDCGVQDDPALKAEQILGLASAKEVRLGRNIVQAKFRGAGGWMLRSAERGQVVLTKVWQKARAYSLHRTACWLAVVGLLVVCAGVSQAQVAVDATTSGQNSFNSIGPHALTFNHSTAVGANLLIVGVSLNISANTGVTVGTVTYNTTALTFIGANNDAGNPRRVEMWYLLNPASGNN